MNNKIGKVFNCSVVNHDYKLLIGEDVKILNEDVLDDGEWVLVEYKNEPYIVNIADIDL